MWTAITNLPRDVRLTGAAYLGTCLLLWPIPVFQVLHVESAAIIAAAAFFAGGLTSLGAFGRGEGFLKILRRQGLLLLLPWILLTISLLWAPNCGYLQGLMFFLLFPGVTIIFAVALAYLLASMNFGYRRFLYVGIGLVTMIGGLLIDYLFHPQLFSYNHVFGGILGPIYDEELAIRPGMFVYRGLTLCWAALFLTTALVREGRLTISVPVVFVLLVGLAYLFAPTLGMVTTESELRKSLGASYEGEHFSIYFQDDALDQGKLQEIADELTYRYAWLSDRLELDPDHENPSARPPGHVHVYLYPDPDTKAMLTGARYTSVAPLWLQTPQIHLLQDRFQSTGAHELAHVFTRPFAATPFNISPIAGLIEGAAVALESPRGVPSPHEQVIANAKERGYEPGELASDMSRRLSPLQFWTGRGAVSYTTVGSFATYLLETYGAPAFRELYRTGRFERLYGKSLDELSLEWEQSLNLIPTVPEGTLAYVRPRFAAPSLFERRCPHYVPSHVRLHREALQAYEDGDINDARTLWEEALNARSNYQPALFGLTRIYREEGRGDRMRDVLNGIDQDTPTKVFLLGDAAVLEDDIDEASEQYAMAQRDALPFHQESRAVVYLRQALLDHRNLLIRWITGRDDVETATDIESMADRTEAYLLAAYLHRQAGDAERAVAIWRTNLENMTNLPDSPHRPEWYRWRADAHYRNRELDEAESWFRQSEKKFLAMGQLPGARHMNDLAGKMRYLSSEADGCSTLQRGSD